METCDRCDRAAYWRVRVNGIVVPLCDWHSYPRLPLEVRRRSFGHSVKVAAVAPSGTSPLMLPQPRKGCGLRAGAKPKASLTGARSTRPAIDRTGDWSLTRDGQPVPIDQAFIFGKTGCLWCECGWQNEAPGLLTCEECGARYELECQK